MYFKGFHFSVDSLWNGDPINHDPVEFHVSAPDRNTIKVDVSGPLFNDPLQPPGPPGHPFPELWEFEGKVRDYMVSCMV